MNKDRLVSGVHILPLRSFIADTYDADAQQRIQEQLSPDTREMLAKVGRGDWYPVHMVAAINRAIYVASDNGDAGYANLVRAGSSIASYATNTFLRLLIKLMTPEIMARKWPTVWSKSHNFGKMDTELDDRNSSRLTMRLSEVDGYDYIGPTAVGFLTFSLNAMGFDDAKVVQQGDTTIRDAAGYEFEITW